MGNLLRSHNYLASAEANNQISDEGVLGLSRAVAHHHSPATGLSQLTATQWQERCKYMLRQTNKLSRMVQCVASLADKAS